MSKDFVGEWKGDYEMDGYPRHVTLTLANNELERRHRAYHRRRQTHDQSHRRPGLGRERISHD